jgi:hypothetical protein
LVKKEFIGYSSRKELAINPEAQMARDHNLLEPVEIAFTVNAQTGWYLDRLVETGLYGNTRREAARVVLYDHCKLLVTDGKLKMAPPIPGGDAVPVVS